MTTNVTQFFREQPHFDALRDTVLPPLIARIKTGGRIRIWSAGCSSGQEPYSIAMTLLGLMPDATARDVDFVATDIDLNMVRAGQAGIYANVSDRHLPRHLRF